MLQVGVKAEALRTQRLPRYLCHGTQHGPGFIKGKAGISLGACHRNQGKGGAHLDSHRPTVTEEKAGEIRAEMAHEGRRALLTCRPGFDQLAFSGDDTNRQNVVSRSASLTTPPEDTVLRQSTSYRGKSTGQRSPVGSSYAKWRELLV